MKKYSGALKDVYLKEVIYNPPATICLWSDKTKTVCKCAEGDIYSPEAGLAICTLKKIYGRDWLIALMRDWLPTYEEGATTAKVTLKDVIDKRKVRR